jgi:phage tail sheath gpL-like
MHHMALQLLPANGDGVGAIPVTFYPLDDDASGVAATADITVDTAVATGNGEFTVLISNIASATFSVVTGDTQLTIGPKVLTAIQAALEWTMLAVAGGTDDVVDLTAKWEGVSSNNMTIDIVGPTDITVSFTITQPNGGLVDPDIQDALDMFGEEIWETLVVNPFDDTNTTALDALVTFNEGRWLAQVRRPFMAFYGSVTTDVNTLITASDLRRTDRTNSYTPEPGAVDLLFALAARTVARIAVTANDVPAKGYQGSQLSNMTPGDDADQWNYTERDLAVKGGVSTIRVIDGLSTIEDSVTHFHPLGDVDPAYRYVVSITKVENILFNTELIFTAAEWQQAPLLADNDPSSEPSAKRPKDAIAAISTMINSLADKAIITLPDEAKLTIVAAIDGTNPNRLNVAFTVKISGNTNIVSVDFNWGFSFGG